MKYSKAFIHTLKEDPKEAEIVSHKLMFRSAMIRKLSSGIYEWLPLGLKVLRKVENIVRKELDSTGALEVFLPALQPKELWEKTGRWDVYGKELMRLKDRHDREFCLGPTHEEIITNQVAREVKSYRDLPVTLYQFQTKFRDEIRPRFGIMRSREFLMKDCYSFDVDDKESIKSYEKMYNAYNNIFEACGLNFKVVEADSGIIGGSFSHEFMVLADTGESKLVYCDCGFSANVEKYSEDSCIKCNKKLSSIHGIEVGHIFKLGTKYSEPLEALFLDEKGIKKPIVMGCYGIGVSRVVAAAIEQNHDKDGIIWTWALAPYQIIITPTNIGNHDIMGAAEKLYKELVDKGYDVILDDRDERAGVKFKDAELLGIPVRVTIGKKFLENKKLEVKIRKTGNVDIVETSELVNYIKEIKAKL